MKLLKSLSKQTKGAITVFISIVLSAVFLVIGVFTDGARLKLAQAQIARADRTALSSVLACYQNELKDEYGLFGLYADFSELQDNYEEYVLRNLNIFNQQNDLYGYSVKNITVLGTANLLDKNILEKQIMEFMKYRAPYTIASDLIKKLDGIKNISSSAKMYKRIIETDRQADEIGNLQLSLEEHVGKINTSGMAADLKGFKNDLMNKNLDICDYGQRLTALQQQYSKTKEQKIKKQLENQIEKVQEDMNECILLKNQIRDNIINRVSQLKNLNTQAKEMAGEIVYKKEHLLIRIEDEVDYTKGVQGGIKELQKSYENNLESMQNIVNQDNASEIMKEIDTSISHCDEILKRSENEADMIQSLENLVEMEKISYTFNKSKPAQSEDQDNREKALQVLRAAMNQHGELKAIDKQTYEKLPSQLEFNLGDNKISWSNMNFTDINCAIQNLEVLSKKEGNFESMLTSVEQQLYINEYIMGTFKHGIPVLKGEAANAGFNLRSKDKKDRDALFSSFEVEYILNGQRDEAVNELFTKSEILAVRLLANVIHIYTDASKMSRISALAAALSAWNAGLSSPLVQTTLILSWAMMESLYDMDQLQKGESVLLFKTAETWKTDISGAVSNSKVPEVDNNPLSLNYHDYLKLFLIMMDKNRKLARVQDLVQLNISVSNPGFHLENCVACLQSDLSVTMKHLFVAINSNRTSIRNKAIMGY